MSNTPYFSSRLRSTYTRPTPNSQAAAHGNKWELHRAFVTLNDRVQQLETRAGGSSISLKTASPVSNPPSPAEVKASAGSGVFRIQITNPQFRVANKGNTPNTPILHRVEFASDQNFSDPVALPLTNQTYIETTQFGQARKFVRVSSSFDGKNFNQSRVLGVYQS